MRGFGGFDEQPATNPGEEAGEVGFPLRGQVQRADDLVEAGLLDPLEGEAEHVRPAWTRSRHTPVDHDGLALGTTHEDVVVTDIPVAETLVDVVCQCRPAAVEELVDARLRPFR